MLPKGKPQTLKTREPALPAAAAAVYGPRGLARPALAAPVFSVQCLPWEKERKKFDYMQINPVKRGLVRAPGDWPWSSWRFYFRQDASVLRMDGLD